MYNARIDVVDNAHINEIYAHFSGEEKDTIISHDDFFLMGDYVFMASKDFFKRINNHQALQLATLDLMKFRTLVKERAFSEGVIIFSNQYMLVIDMDNEGFNAALERGELEALTQEFPLLLPIVEKRLGKSMPAGKRFKRIDPDGDNGIFIRKDGREYYVNIKELMSISEYFESLKIDCAKTYRIELEDEVPNSLRILNMLSKKKNPEITKDNVLELASLAAYYRIKILATPCDDYVIEHDLLKPLTVFWFKRISRELTNETNDQGTFCTEFGFERAKRNMLNSLAQQLLSKGINKDDVYGILSPLMPAHREYIFNSLSEFVTSKLNNKDHLAFYANLAIDFKITNLKSIVYDFCKNPENQVTVREVYIKIPHKLQP